MLPSFASSAWLPGLQCDEASWGQGARSSGGQAALRQPQRGQGLRSLASGRAHAGPGGGGRSTSQRAGRQEQRRGARARAGGACRARARAAGARDWRGRGPRAAAARARRMLPTSIASSRPTSCQQVPWSMLNSSVSAGPSVSCLAMISRPPWSPYLPRGQACALHARARVRALRTGAWCRVTPGDRSHGYSRASEQHKRAGRFGTEAPLRCCGQQWLCLKSHGRCSEHQHVHGGAEPALKAQPPQQVTVRAGTPTPPFLGLKLRPEIAGRGGAALIDAGVRRHVLPAEPAIAGEPGAHVVGRLLQERARVADRHDHARRILVRVEAGAPVWRARRTAERQRARRRRMQARSARPVRGERARASSTTRLTQAQRHNLIQRMGGDYSFPTRAQILKVLPSAACTHLIGATPGAQACKSGARRAVWGLTLVMSIQTCLVHSNIQPRSCKHCPVGMGVTKPLHLAFQAGSA